MRTSRRSCPLHRSDASRFRILALDVDGTLLDPDGTLRPRTAAAVARAAGSGIRPVLCTGRRHRRARPIATQLGLNAPIVCNSGAIVKDPQDHRTLWRADFDPSLSRELHAGLGVAMGHAPADVLAVADLVTGDHDQDGVAM